MNNDSKATIVLFVIAAVSLIIILILSLIFGGKTTKRVANSKSKKEMARDNKFVVENKERIGQIIDNNSKELKSLRMRVLFSLIFLIVGVLLVFLVRPIIISFIILILSIIVFAINLINYSRINNEKYEEVVREVLRGFDSNLQYLPNNGFTINEYYTCLFPEECDRFSSEDMIVNPKTFFSFSDILVESEYEDDDGQSHYTTEYRGSLARMSVKDINCKIFLGGVNRGIIYRKDGYTDIEFENDEFNELFRACTDDEMIAYKILTPDVMEEFVNIKNSTYGDIDIRIINDKLYIRFSTGDTFDSEMFDKEAEKEHLFQSIAVLEEVMKTMNKVKEIIEKKNMD